MNHGFNDALVLVFARNAFYKRLHFLALGALALMVVTIGVLIGVLVYVAKMQAMPVYFATDNVSRLIPVRNLQRPEMTTEDVTAWAIEAVQAAYSYDYLNYRSQLQGAQKYFTNYGWIKYMNALEASNNLEGVKERRWIGIAKIVEKPKLLAAGPLGSAFAWKFQMPVLITYLRPPNYNESNMRVDPLTLTVLIQTQPALQSYKGLGIIQIVGELATQQIEQPEQAPELAPEQAPAQAPAETPPAS